MTPVHCNKPSATSHQRHNVAAGSARRAKRSEQNQKRAKRAITYFLIFILAYFSAACDHKELCIHQPGDPYAAIPFYVIADQYEDTDPDTTDPLQLRPLPTGFRMTEYIEQGTPYTDNLPTEGGQTYMADGDRPLLFYNNDTHSILIDGTDSYANATATTRTRTRGSYRGSPFARQGEPETLLSQPDWLWGTYRPAYNQQRDGDTLHITMHSLVHVYKVIVHCTEGIDDIQLARGAFYGLTTGVWLGTGTNRSETATLLFDFERPDQQGELAARLTTFGLPDYPHRDYTRAGDHFALNIETKVTGGYLVSRDYDITDQVLAQPLGGYIHIYDYRITPDDLKPARESGAIQVTVEGWGDYTEVEII